MPLTPTLYDHVADIPPDDWTMLAREKLARPKGRDAKNLPTDHFDLSPEPAPDLPMDLRLLESFQSSMGDQCRSWLVIFRDELGEPAACACLARFEVDATEITGPAAQAITRRIRRVLPGYMRFGVMFCGLPVPSGASHLRWACGIDPAEVIDALDGLLQQLARQTRARLVVIKELDEQNTAALIGLRDRGYLRGDVPAAYTFSQPFESFEDYPAALRSRYRRQVTESQNQFSRAGGSAEVITGADIAAAFTDEVHGLYLAVRDRAKYRMETLPADFFRRAGRSFGEDASLVLLRLDSRVAGFAFGISAGSEYHNLYIGLDYARNNEADLYFNLHFHDMGRAFRRGCTKIHMGQTADAFKTRMGFVGEPLSFYVQAVNPLVRTGLRRAARWVFPPVQQHQTHAIFKAVEPKRKAVESLG